MKKFIKDTEILFILSSYLRHIEVLLMTSYCKKFIGFPSIIPENLSFYRNKLNEIKRENGRPEHVIKKLIVIQNRDEKVY